MSSDWSAFLSRDELLGGLPARRASTLLFAIESRTVALVARSRQAMATYRTEATAAEQERAFLDALAQGREGTVRPAIQDLERYAPVWAELVPPDVSLRAALARMIGTAYLVPERGIPGLRSALGLDDPAVRDAYQRLHGQPLETLFTARLPRSERLRWVRSRIATSLETLSPAWTAFALTLTETVGAGVLALPIATAAIGPLAGVVIIVLLGLVNVVTIAAISEAVARNGNVRYGHAFFGRLIRDYLGRPGLWLLTPALALLNVVLLVAYYIGLATTLDGATGVPPEIWAALLFVVALAILRRDSLDATVASALVIGATNIGLILLLALLTLPHISGANLRHVSVPFINGEPFTPSLLDLVFGVVLLAFFGHTSAGNCAAVVLRRDPSARSFIRGSIAATMTAMAIYVVWVVAVNGAVPPSALTGASGTALEPLADEVGSVIHLVGAIFAVLAMGMASIHFSLGLINQVREWLPPVDPRATARSSGVRGLVAHPTGQIVIEWLPIVLVLIAVEGLLITDRQSFAGPLAFLGTITASIIGGVVPMLLLVASRRKGDYALVGVWRFLGQPVVVAVISILFLVGIVLHGLIIWEQPYQRAAALVTAVATVIVGATAARQGAFRPRAVVELRVEPNAGESAPPAIVNVVARGESVTPEIRWPGGANQNGWAPNGFRSVEIDLPALDVDELRIWAHQLDPMGAAAPLPVMLDIEETGSDRRADLRLSGGQIVLPASGNPARVNIRAD